MFRIEMITRETEGDGEKLVTRACKQVLIMYRFNCVDRVRVKCRAVERSKYVRVLEETGRDTVSRETLIFDSLSYTVSDRSYF